MAEQLVLAPGQKIRLAGGWYTVSKTVIFTKTEPPPLPGEYFGDEAL